MADAEEAPTAVEHSFMEEGLARGPGIVTGSELEWEQQVQALGQALEKAAQEGIPRVP